MSAATPAPYRRSDHGDHYVRVALEALAAGERTLEANLTPRVALYHVFHAIWCTSGAQLESRGGDDDTPGVDDTTRRLMRIAPRSRQAFLLTALEGFTPSEAAQILGAEFGEVERLIAEAQAEIDAELATEVLIIEDEPVIAIDVEERPVVGDHIGPGVDQDLVAALESRATKVVGSEVAQLQEPPHSASMRLATFWRTMTCR
jgi:hypothetical protein